MWRLQPISADTGQCAPSTGLQFITGLTQTTVLHLGPDPSGIEPRTLLMSPKSPVHFRETLKFFHSHCFTIFYMLNIQPHYTVAKISVHISPLKSSYS